MNKDSSSFSDIWTHHIDECNLFFLWKTKSIIILLGIEHVSSRAHSCLKMIISFPKAIASSLSYSKLNHLIVTMCNQQNHHVQEFRNMLFIKSIKLSKVMDGFWKGFTRKMSISCLAPWISSHPKRHRASDPSTTRRWKQGRPCCSWRYGRLLARSATCPRKPIEWILEHGIWQSQNTKNFLLHSTHQGLYKALIIDKRSSILDKNCLHTSKCFSPKNSQIRVASCHQYHAVSVWGPHQLCQQCAEAPHTSPVMETSVSATIL